MSDLDQIDLQNVKKVLDEYCRDFTRLYKQKLRDDGKSGKHLDNIETKIHFNGSTITVVINVADYYKWVENGRKPYGRGHTDYQSHPEGSYPPIASIKDWIKDKHIIPREENGKLPTEDQLAFLISRKIAYKGIEPGNQMKKTIQELNNIYIARLKSALIEDFGQYQLKLLKEINTMIKI